MSKAELQKKILQETKNLPSDSLFKVLKFIELLKEQKSGKTLPKNNLEKALQQLNQESAAHLEEEFMNYKDLFPHEK